MVVTEKWTDWEMKKYQGMNLENVKSSNQSAVLRLLNNNGAMSRKDIAEAVGLTAASVTLICTELLEKGIIVELGEVTEEKRAGRKKILVDINPNYKKAMCIAIEMDMTYLSVTDMKGEVIASSVMETGKSDPEEYLKQVADTAGKLLWDCDISKDRLLGVGVTVPGMVDTKNGVSQNAHNIWGRALPVRDIMSKHLGTEVLVENNLKSSAEYEILFGRGRSEKNIFLLKWGPGVGSAMIIDGQIYSGATNKAGEIGHMTLGKDGRLCSCGKRGCLETYISTHAILDDVKLMTGDSSAYKKELSLLAGDEVHSLMDEKIDRLAISLCNSMTLFDPDRVVVLGYMFDVPGVFDRFKAMYKSYDAAVTDDFIVRSELSMGGGHVEPLAMLLNSFLKC